MSARGNSSKDATYDTSDGSSGSCCCTILLVLLLQAQAVSSAQADGEDVSDIVILFRLVPFDQTKEICFVFYFSLRSVLPFTMKTGGKKVSGIIFTKQRQKKNSATELI